MPYRIMASRHSAFYSPLLCCVQQLRAQGIAASYDVLKPGQRTYELLRDRHVDIMQSAVSSNWSLMENGAGPLPVHFAQINRRDGFFIVARQADPAFAWKKLEGTALLADHGLQPLVMLKYALKYNGVDWGKIRVIDAGAPDKMEAAFRAGNGDYLHQQGPVAAGEIVAPVGAAMPPVAFSSLCCAREYQQTQDYAAFVEFYGRAKEWVQSVDPGEVAAAEAEFFPQVARSILAATVRRYQSLGCWAGGIDIPRDLYEQALNVFESSGAISRRHRFEEVVR